MKKKYLFSTVIFLELKNSRSKVKTFSFMREGSLQPEELEKIKTIQE